jgi:hypothetical protein
MANRKVGPLLVMTTSLASMIWGYLGQRPYWVTLSIIAVAWSLWALHTTASLSLFSWGSIFAMVVSVTIIGSMISPENLVLLESLAAPVLLYLLCTGIIVPTVGATQIVGPKGTAFLSAIAPISVGTAVLLMLYHLDNADLIGWLDGNSHFMWNLCFLFFYSIALAYIDRKIGLQSQIYQHRRPAG